MEHTKENYKAAQEVIDTLYKNGCTVERSQEILRFAAKKIVETATVQRCEDLLTDFV